MRKYFHMQNMLQKKWCCAHSTADWGIKTVTLLAIIAKTNVTFNVKSNWKCTYQHRRCEVLPVGLWHPHMEVCLLSRHHLWDRELFHLSALHCPWSDCGAQPQYQTTLKHCIYLTLCSTWISWKYSYYGSYYIFLVRVIIQTRAVFCPALPFVVMSLSDDDIS